MAEAINNPLGGAGNTIGGEFCWHEFFVQLQQIGYFNMPIIHLPLEQVGVYAAEFFGQHNYFSGNKVSHHFQFKPKHQLSDTLRSAVLN